MNKFIMVAGPSAVGKSTLVQGLHYNLGGYIYKPSHAFVELAKKRNFDVRESFELISDEDAYQHFITICKSHDLVIGDQHLAIQPQKDNALAWQIDRGDIKEDYTHVNYDLFSYLEKESIKTILLYLKADYKLLYERALQRHDMVVRNKNLEEAKFESFYEESFYNEVIENFAINHVEIDISYKSKDEVLDYALRKIKKFR